MELGGFNQRILEFLLENFRFFSRKLVSLMITLNIRALTTKKVYVAWHFKIILSCYWSKSFVCICILSPLCALYQRYIGQKMHCIPSSYTINVSCWYEIIVSLAATGRCWADLHLGFWCAEGHMPNAKECIKLQITSKIIENQIKSINKSWYVKVLTNAQKYI